MEKNMYETYEFLPTTSAAAEAEQFFVVQNDGTLLINRQVQYVSQVQDGKEVLENVQPLTAVFDMSSQQYFVDVDNSTELISVSDQYVLPPDANSSNFGSNYLLQSIPSIQATSVQMAESVELQDVKELKATTGGDQTTISTTQVPETSNFTEVTLNDEQCRLLESKGWVLLDMSGKVYLLNTLGLHDITSNKKLIQDLKNDVELIKNEPPTSNNCTVNGSNSYDADYMLATNGIQNQTDIVSDGGNAVSAYLIRRDVSASCGIELNECTGDGDSIANRLENEEQHSTKQLPENSTSSNMATVPSDNKQTSTNDARHCDAPDSITEPQKKKPTMIVRLKTRLSVEDIPNKIFLGKTVNGKSLVARVKSIKRPAMSMDDCSKPDHQEPTNDPSHVPESTKTAVNKKSTKEAYYKAKKVESLIRKHMANLTELTCSAEDVNSAEIIIKQLVNVPATRTPMVDRNIIFTKIEQTMRDGDTLVSESEPTLVTGRVAQFDDQGDWHFVYIPHLFQNLHICGSNNESEMTTGENPDDYLLHVHALEVKRPNEETKTSITFSKKRIPPFRQQQQQLTNKAMYACCACAKIFDNEHDLSQHHALGCVKVEKPPLIIDTDKASTRPQISRKNTQVSSSNAVTCIYCKTIVKLASYRRHLQSHLGPTRKLVSPDDDSDVKNIKGQRLMYKCQMCTSVYYHASSLSKHIMKNHIRSNICSY